MSNEALLTARRPAANADRAPELPANVATLVTTSDAALEDVIAGRVGALLARIGDGAPDLHETVMSQAERGLFKAVLAHTGNHLVRASRILGLDRNTCAKKARAFGLVDEPARGRKPRAKGAKKLKKIVRRAGKKSR